MEGYAWVVWQGMQKKHCMKPAGVAGRRVRSPGVVGRMGA